MKRLFRFEEREGFKPLGGGGMHAHARARACDPTSLTALVSGATLRLIKYCLE